MHISNPRNIRITIRKIDVLSTVSHHLYNRFSSTSTADETLE
tara:strand:- start:174 stop:299 length:126 start_codon:yes stop_codon:yes gene_type:complete